MSQVTLPYPLQDLIDVALGSQTRGNDDAIVAVLYLGLIGIAIFTPRAQAPEVAYWPDPDHPGEDISSLDV